MNLELSSAYDDEAQALLREAGLEGRAVRLLRDIAVEGGDIEPADVVVLNRVVCCYPDYERLLTAARPRAAPHGLQLSAPEPDLALRRGECRPRLRVLRSSSARSPTRRPRCSRC